jgi:hypothetical protein
MFLTGHFFIDEKKAETLDIAFPTRRGGIKQKEPERQSRHSEAEFNKQLQDQHVQQYF